MNLPEHNLTINSEYLRKVTRRWLLLGIAALALAGVFAAMLANTKGAYFYTALVAHVDLSVLVWFLAFGCLIMTLAMPWGALAILGRAGYVSTALAMLLIALAAFSGGTPYQNNYIPVIHHRVFFIALGLLFSGVTCIVVQFLLSHNTATATTPVRVGVMSIAVILLMSGFCFLWSYHTMPEGMHGETYFEHVFWAGGHMLQIAYAQLMILAWLWLAEAGGVKLKFGRRLPLVAYALGVLCAIGGVVLSLMHAPATTAHVQGFTHLMRYGNGVPSLLVGCGIVYSLLSQRALPLPVICLWSSGLLYAVGGGLGFLIQGSNVIVPAHYHGSIVGVTLSLMGVAYLLLPQVGWRDVSGSRLAWWQPVLYGSGQICWMMGMAIGGAYGMARKMPGSADLMGGVAGFLKHGGDGLSLIGGLLFVYVVLKAMAGKKRGGLIPTVRNK